MLAYNPDSLEKFSITFKDSVLVRFGWRSNPHEDDYPDDGDDRADEIIARFVRDGELSGEEFVAVLEYLGRDDYGNMEDFDEEEENMYTIAREDEPIAKISGEAIMAIDRVLAHRFGRQNCLTIFMRERIDDDDVVRLDRSTEVYDHLVGVRYVFYGDGIYITSLNNEGEMYFDLEGHLLDADEEYSAYFWDSSDNRFETEKRRGGLSVDCERPCPQEEAWLDAGDEYDDLEFSMR
jgi:hypothetical protein